MAAILVLAAILSYMHSASAPICRPGWQDFRGADYERCTRLYGGALTPARD